jgi:hypothetical protein
MFVEEPEHAWNLGIKYSEAKIDDITDWIEVGLRWAFLGSKGEMVYSFANSARLSTSMEHGWHWLLGKESLVGNEIR